MSLSDSLRLRRLAAVWFADLVGYSRLASEDEEAALRLVDLFQAVVRREVEAHAGHLVKFLGDGALAEFGNSEAAVGAALSLQHAFASEAHAAGLASALRVGVHIGEVTTGPDGDLYGDGINVAARLQSEAEPGQVLVSEYVRQHLRSRRTYRFEDGGERTLKGQAEPLRVFAVALREDPERAASLPDEAVRRVQAAQPYQGADALRGSADGRAAEDRLRLRARGTRAAPVAWTGRRRAYLSASLAAALLVLISLGLFVTGRQPDGAATATAEQTQVAIAVLPLANLSGDTEQEYFSDGMTDALISDLGTIGALKVISRTSIMRFKNSERPLPEIARDLNVSHIIEGTVLQAEGKVRIVTRLIEAETDQLLWTGSYEKDLQDVLSLQREVARSIADAIGVRLTPQQQARLAAAPTANPQAYTAYLQGLVHWNNRPPVGQAIQYFEQAIELDPAFALAHAMLGGCYAVGGDGRFSRQETGRRAKEAITRALTLDGTTTEAYNMLGWVNAYFDWDWEGAAQAYLRALELNPSYADAYHRYTHYLMMVGRTEEALEASRRARELGPLDRAIIGHHVWDLYMTRQYDRAIAYSQQILEADPDNHYAFAYALPAYELQGRYDGILSADPERVGSVNRARALALSGREAEAREVLGALLSRPDHPNAPIGIALVYAALGETESAFEWLEEAFSRRSYPLPDLRIDPRFDPLRSDPRFDALLERMGLET